MGTGGGHAWGRARDVDWGDLYESVVGAFGRDVGVEGSHVGATRALRPLSSFYEAFRLFSAMKIEFSLNKIGSLTSGS